MDMLKASIKTYTYNEYFKSVKWITRKGEVSLSITPTNKLYGRTYNNANVLAVHAATAWWRTYINVNLESIVILCNWVDGMNSAKEFQTLK